MATPLIDVTTGNTMGINRPLKLKMSFGAIVATGKMIGVNCLSNANQGGEKDGNSGGVNDVGGGDGEEQNREMDLEELYKVKGFLGFGFLEFLSTLVVEGQSHSLVINYNLVGSLGAMLRLTGFGWISRRSLV
ncbi:hypothetical protein K2173_001689 [Erythroxylum novogranatense]|uniref:Uncharacterized protein n=1 Tax=Erythroxylum novogranatense TaxID=1862640 RepID=A0AAV8S4M9_9ROSI|nr:hypothetical protein K2173_001689 [Erythroxylum novogranatense]